MKVKRKVLKVGNASLAVSLPSKWVKRHELKAGDELEVHEDEALTVTKSGTKRQQREISLHIDDFTYYTLSRYLTEIYRENYQRVSLTFTKKTLQHQKKEREVEVQATINKLVQRFIGAEIVSQTGKRVEIEFFVPEEERDLEKIEKRIYFLFKETFNEQILGLKNDYETFHKTAYDRHDNITKFINFYLRTLRSSKRPEAEQRATHALYVHLDKAADIMRHISDAIKKHGHTQKLAEDLREILEYFTSQFTILFKEEDDYALVKERYRIRKKVESGTYTVEEAMVLGEAFILLDFVNFFTEVLITRKLAHQESSS